MLETKSLPAIRERTKKRLFPFLSFQTCRHKYENTTEARRIAGKRFYEWIRYGVCERIRNLEKQLNQPIVALRAPPHVKNRWERLTQTISVTCICGESESFLTCFHEWNLKIQSCPLSSLLDIIKNYNDVIRLLARDTRNIWTRWEKEKTVACTYISSRVAPNSLCWWLNLNILL